MTSALWQICINKLENELSEQQLNTWIRPLHAIENNGELKLLAPNRFVLDWVQNNFLARIDEIVHPENDNKDNHVVLEIGSSEQAISYTKKKKAVV